MAWDERRDGESGFTEMTNFLRRNPHGEGYISFSRFQNHYEGVSSLVVANGFIGGEPMADLMRPAGGDVQTGVYKTTPFRPRKGNNILG